MREFEIPICVNDQDNQFFGTRTERNLWTAYAGESMAALKYFYYASVVKKAGYEVLAELFQKTANNEIEHAKIWYKKLKQLPKLPIECVSDAVSGELHEWSTMYKGMANDAIEDGFDELATLFSNVSEIEKNHATNFQLALSNLDTGAFFRQTGLIIWECRNCGYRVISDVAPNACPVCEHPQGYFQAVN